MKPRNVHTVEQVEQLHDQLQVKLLAEHEILVSRKSTELSGLLKLMFDGTFSKGPPALHGAGAGHADNSFQSFMIALS